jgi:hypothetical protein
MPVIVAVVVAVTVLVGMVVVVMVVVAQGNRDAIGLTGTGALELAEGAALDQALDVVVVALLGSPDLGLKAQDLSAVLAERAVHLGLAAHDLLDPLLKGVDHQGVIP